MTAVGGPASAASFSALSRLQISMIMPSLPSFASGSGPGVFCICSVLRTEQIPRGVPVPPANPPGEERSPGKGNPFPESPTRRRRRFPASKRHRRPGANPSPILRERFGVSFRFTVHAAETDHNRREIPPIPPRCCHTFVLLHTRLNSYIGSFFWPPGAGESKKLRREFLFLFRS